MLRVQNFEDSDEIPSLRESSSINTRILPPLGRIFGILFAVEPRELDRVLSRDGSGSNQGYLGKAASALVEHIKDRISIGLSLEQICVPILEHAVKSKDSSYRKRSILLLRWLLQNRDSGGKVGSTLETVIGATTSNKRVKLGWCVLIREVEQGWSGQVGVETSLHSNMLEIFVGCIPQLVNIVIQESVKEGKQRVPTRLTIAAADCLLTITNTLAAEPPAQPDVSQEQTSCRNQRKRSLITPIDPTTGYGRTDWLAVDIKMDDGSSTSDSDFFSNTKRRELALWGHLDHLISLVRELTEWNGRERPLFTKGLQYIHRRLQSLALYRDSIQSQGEDSDVSVGAAVLTASWQHFGGLILTEDKKVSSHRVPAVQHWLGALQYYLQQTVESDADDENQKTMEMRAYALACLTLVLGRLDTRRLEITLRELGPELLKAMFDQLCGADDNVVDLAAAIVRVILFRPSSSTSGDCVGAAQLESVLPILLEMLDTRDTAARAVVLLVAEYFAANPESNEMERLFSRLDSEEYGHRRNALDVLSELLSICSRSVDMINSSLSQTIAKHLFKRLGDVELTNRMETSALFPKLDPAFTLPPLLKFLYSPDGRIRSAASASVLSVLKGQTNQTKVVTELLDCATNMVKYSLSGQSLQPGAATKGRKSDGPLDVDRIMRLIPDWAATVEDWENVIPVVLSKMFQEPANAVIPRFLSSISNQLADQVHLVFPMILEEMRGQSKLLQDLHSELSGEDSRTSDGVALGRELFQRLSPLLILRVLPLSAFNDHNCKELYGELSVISEDDGALGTGAVCITNLLLERVCGEFEFEDVRKVASELTGRLLPDIMIPLVTAQLENASVSQDLFRVKACIYVFCTSLGIRVQESLNHPFMTYIRQLLTSILLWQRSKDEKGYVEVGKVQHGCIDCLAMMICAELQPQRPAPRSEQSPVQISAQAEMDSVDELAQSKEVETVPLSPKIRFVEELPDWEQLRCLHVVGSEQNRLGEEVSAQGEGQAGSLVKRTQSIEELSDSNPDPGTDFRGVRSSGSYSATLSPVLACLIGEQQKLPWHSSTQLSGLTDVTNKNCAGKGHSFAVPRAFRVCMANVLISCCQKVAVGARKLLASRITLSLINFVQVSDDAKLKGACLQVLFTAVYHLKASAVLPYAVDLFDLSLSAIKRRGFLEERINGAKLLASLLGSDEFLVKDLAPHLDDAQLVLSSVSAIDTSPELRVICEKLLSCLSTPDEGL